MAQKVEYIKAGLNSNKSFLSDLRYYQQKYMFFHVWLVCLRNKGISVQTYFIFGMFIGRYHGRVTVDHTLK